MLKILIVDDTKSVHSYVKALCKNLDIHFSSAFDGEEALSCLEENQDIDLIFLDWEMPKMDGPETLRNLGLRGSSVPVVMMTTKNSFDDVSSMLNAGASDYMMKPFTVDILQEKLSFVLGCEVDHAA